MTRERQGSKVAQRNGVRRRKRKKPSGGALERATYTIEETAAYLGISRQAAYSAARRGDIPVIRLGRRWLVPKLGLERHLAGEQADAWGR